MQTKRLILIFLLTSCLAAAQAQAQRPLGNDRRVNVQTAGSQTLPDVATAADGSFVVAWRLWNGSSQPGYIMARLFDAAGRPRSGDIQVARVTPRIFGGPSVAMAPDGRFVVVWTGGQEDPTLAFGRRYAADGTPLGARFRLARISGQADGIPDVAMHADGSFVAVWAQDVRREGVPDLDIYVRRFRADGKPRGPERPLVSGELEENGPRIALRPEGGFALAWQAWGGEGSFYDIRAQLFSDDGAPRSDELAVNEGSPFGEASQHSPDVAVATDGSFAVVWTDTSGDLDGSFDPEDGQKATGVRIRFYDADAIPLGPESAANTHTSGPQEFPAIDALPNGGYLAIWVSGPRQFDQPATGQDGDGFGLFGRAFTAEGTRQGREFRVNAQPAGSQYLPALSLAPNGKGAAAWMISGEDSEVFVRRIGPR
jgi:hypothetical protein